MREEIELLERMLERMKLINGDKDGCVKGQNWGNCENHSLIWEVEAFLRESDLHQFNQYKEAQK